MERARVLLVDDDASIRETLELHFRGAGHEVATAASAEEALAQLAMVDPTLVVTDVRMGGMDGLALLELIRARRPDVDVVVMTAFEDMRTAIGAMKAGAFDYLVKPLDLDQHRSRRRAVRARVSGCDAALRSSPPEAAEPYALSQLVGRDPRMIDIYKTIGAVARSRTPVLIRGETGTGKELIARAIHFNSADAARAVRGGQLRGDPGAAAGERAVRAREGRVHRRDRRPEGAVRARGRRDDLPGRDRRHDAPRSRRSCCACCRSASSTRWAANERGAPKRAWSRRRIGRSSGWCARGGSARICTSGCASWRSSCRRCASGEGTSRCWPSISARERARDARRGAGARAGCGGAARRRTTGRGTCASWRTR